MSNRFRYSELDKRNLPISQVMQSARMGEANAIAMINEMGIERVLNSYTYYLCRRVRHLWYFRAYTDKVNGYAKALDMPIPSL